MLRRLCFSFLVLATVGCGRVALDPDLFGTETGGSSSGGGDTGGAGTGGFGTGGFGTGGLSTGGFGTGGLGTGGFGTGGLGTGGFGTGGFGTGGLGTGGIGSDCDFASDCIPQNSCETGACLSGKCVFSLKDADGDGQEPTLCGGADCNDNNPKTFSGATENCTDGDDNDGDGVADCFDPSCVGGPCGCSPSPGGENCENGNDDDCDGFVDCLDPGCGTSPSCGCNAENCENGADDDCDGFIDCSDPSCASDTNCDCQATGEICNDKKDTDCDGLVDCSDPDCFTNGLCACTSPKLESCTNGKDDDCDGLVDCGDPNCFSNASCKTCKPEECSGGLDEDCDGKIDCADPSCALSTECPVTAEICNNSRDDDFDGKIDCIDADCKDVPLCIEEQGTCATAKTIQPLGSFTFTGTTIGQISNYSGTCGGAAGEDVFRFVLSSPTRVHFDTVGSNFDTVLYLRKGNCELGEEVGCDDDGGASQTSSALDFDTLPAGTYFVVVDGLTIDPVFGTDEGIYFLNVELDIPSENCTDDKDNDGDQYVDCADSDCTNVGACFLCRNGTAPVPEFGVGRCTNGIDDDCDGTSDCADDDCSASESTPIECCNGVEESGNNILDDFACRCKTSADCSFGQLCYTSTTRTCGIACDAFVGDICPFLAAGSYCNTTTHQCEF